MIVLWILLGLIALIFLLLCIPVRFDLNYNGEATVFIRYLFLKYRVLPAPEPIKEKKPSEKKSEEQAKEKKPNPLLRQVNTCSSAAGKMPPKLLSCTERCVRACTRLCRSCSA